ncbi:acetyl-CoA synthetase-like protein [Xylariaceae sp. FL0016]|nr:acetyl-CoA synthetase-like protein [Xylariaceae sp. FL0016]
MAGLYESSNRTLNRAECFGGPVPNIDRPLWSMLSDTVSRFPHHDAVVSLWQSPATIASSLSPRIDKAEQSEKRMNSILRWSYVDLERKSIDLANCLHSLGCRSGTPLGVMLWNSAEWALFFWASARLGLVFVPIDPRCSDTDMQHYLDITQPVVMVVQDDALLKRYEDVQLGQEQGRTSSLLHICCQYESDVDGWQSLEAVLQTPRSNSPDVPVAEARNDRPSVVVFTSGTTGTPKGCPLTSANMWSQVGGTVVYPSKSFEVKATLRALLQEKCTFMSAVPALLKALVSDKDYPGRERLSLHYVTLGSTIIGEDDIRLCHQTLLNGKSPVAIQCFGLSEGAPVASWTRSDPLLKDGYHPGVGKALPGGNLRICKPGTRDVLGYNEKGELHIGGTSVIYGYLGGVSQESFYNDSAGNWFLTGDQASIDENGALHIVGRYKDIIIRGGINIVPAVIERALNEIGGVVSQVIGISDHVAGQLPVAVIKAPASVSKRTVAARATNLGKNYVLAAIYTLEDLGLAGFPATISGKVRKQELKKIVESHRQRVQTPPPEAHNATSSRVEEMKRGLQNIWQELVGIKPEHDELVTSFADSITILRYCDKVTANLGRRIYLQDFIRHPTISSQAMLLEERSTMFTQWETGNEGIPYTLPTPPNSATKRQFTSFDGGRANKLRVSKASIGKKTSIGSEQQDAQVEAAATGIVAANQLEIGDVQGILPVRDLYHRLASGPRPQSYRNRFAIHLRSIERVDRALEALKAALSSRPMFRTLLCDSGDRAYHIVMKPSETLFAHLIKTTSVTNDQERDKIFQRQSADAFSSVFMLQAEIITVRDTGEMYLVTTLNHSVFDAMSLIPWHRDLDRFMQDPKFVAPSMTSFKMFTDLTHLYQSSLPAQESIDINIQRLRGISRFPDALWPPQRAPGWHMGNDIDTPHATERNAIREQVWDDWAARESDFQFPRIIQIVNLPAIEELRTTQAIEPSLFAKVAVALFNVYETGEPFAIFNHLDAARSWPFVPSWMDKGLPPPMSIDGPTFEFVLNMTNINLRGEETIRQLLARMTQEHEELGAHAHAPWLKIVEGLGNEAEAVVDASYRQTFVWDVSLRMLDPSTMDFQVLKVVKRFDWADCGIFWNCCMLDKSSMMIVASWDTAQMNDVEVEGYCDTLADIMRRLADVNNFDKSLRDVFGGQLGRAAYGGS